MPIDFPTGGDALEAQTGLGLKSDQNQKAALNQNAIESAQQPMKELGTEAIKQNIDMVTITPQLAKGISSLSGDNSANQMVGMKVKSNLLAAMVASITRRKMTDDIINGRVDVEGMKEKASKDLADSKASGKADNDKAMEDLKNQHKKEIEELKAKNAKDKASTPKPGKEDTPDQKKEKASKILDDISKSKDPSAKKALIDNYNQLAQANGMSPYQEGEMDKIKDQIGGAVEGMAKKAGSALGLGGDDDKKSKAKKILEDAGKPVTDANIKHVMDQLQ